MRNQDENSVLNRIVVWIGIVGSLVTIFVFLTGFANFQEVWMWFYTVLSDFEAWKNIKFTLGDVFGVFAFLVLLFLAWPEIKKRLRLLSSKNLQEEGIGTATKSRFSKSSITIVDRAEAAIIGGAWLAIIGAIIGAIWMAISTGFVGLASVGSAMFQGLIVGGFWGGGFGVVLGAIIGKS